MPKKRIIESEHILREHLDITTWPTVLIDNLSTEDQVVYLSRKQAVELYLRNDLTIKEITEKTGIDDSSLRRLVRRCLEFDPTGNIWGYRALIPRKRVNDYVRKEMPGTNNTSVKMTGAFLLLLQKYPVIKEKIDKLYLGTDKTSVQEPVIRVKHLHKKFLDECRKVGLTIHEYPFNTTHLARRSLERYVKKLEQQNFTKAARRYGDEAAQIARSTGILNQNAPMIIRPFERVQFDGHRIDAVLAISFRTPEGDEIVEIMDRIWLLVIIDVATRVVIGYHLSLNKEYSASDVLHCVKNAIVPKTAMKLTIPGLKYHESGGFTSATIPETEWALWDELLYDNDKANLASVVNERLTQIVACAVNAGPVSLPVRRGYIERFFGTLEENGFHRLPNTTGSRPGDPRRQKPEEKAIKYRITVDQLEELTDVMISDYNGTPHEGLNNLSPLEVMKQRIERGYLPRIMPEEQRRDTHFLSLHAQRSVKGNIQDGRRPSIFYEGVEYRSDVLSRSPNLIGMKLDLIINTEDLRVIRAYLTDGSEFGTLTAAGKWGISPHTLQIRKQINKLRSQKLLHYTSADDPIECYHRYLEEKAKSNKTSRNKLADLKRKQKDHTNKDPQETGLPSDEVKNQPIAPLAQPDQIVRRDTAFNTKLFRTITY
jgi:putative transposase